MRVLLIEDDSATAQSIELMLQSEGFNVYTTDLGEEGVDLGKLYDYDIILLDLNLPDMSGYEVLKTLRVSKVQTPILILSGLAGIEDKVRGLGFGADDYMTKPFHKDELVARIHAIVRRSKGHAQSVIQTGGLKVNLDTKTVDVNGQRVHLTGKEYQMLELLSLAQGHDADQGDVPEPSLWRHGRAGAQDHRRLYLQAAQEARGGDRRQALYRDGVGPRLCAAQSGRRVRGGLAATYKVGGRETGRTLVRPVSFWRNRDGKAALGGPQLDFLVAGLDAHGHAGRGCDAVCVIGLDRMGVEGKAVHAGKQARHMLR